MKIRALSAAALALASIHTATALAQSPQSHEHSFGDAQQWSRVFDDPARDEWQKPHQVILALELKPDALVADIGSGTGYFSVRLAHAVAKGQVYGVDLEPKMVKYLADRAKKEGLANVSAIAGGPDDARLPQKVDAVLIVDTYHHIGSRERYFRKLGQSLKPGARIAVIDFNAESKMGPPPGERMAPARVIAEMDKAGYKLLRQHDFLPNQYFLIFEAKNRQQPPAPAQ